jgi:hypothetical protein
MNNEGERVWQEVTMASFKVLSQYLYEEAEENHKKISQ